VPGVRTHTVLYCRAIHVPIHNCLPLYIEARILNTRIKEQRDVCMYHVHVYVRVQNTRHRYTFDREGMCPETQVLLGLN